MAAVESLRGFCYGQSCPDMSWLVAETIKQNYPAGLLPEEHAQISADESDYAMRECIREGVCLAKLKRSADEGAIDA